jgi:hypothetical protein
MRWWFHIIAAVAGFFAAGLIVYLVFGQADTGTGVTHKAPVLVQGTQNANDCGTLTVAQANLPTTVTTSLQDLPNVSYNGKLIVPGVPAQKAWFARIDAASGLCVDEVDVTATTIRVETSFPPNVPEASIQSFAFGALLQSFQPPLARKAVRLDVKAGTHTRTIALTASAWHVFQRVQPVHRLPSTIAGIVLSRRDVDYGRTLYLSGW